MALTLGVMGLGTVMALLSRILNLLRIARAGIWEELLEQKKGVFGACVVPAAYILTMALGFPYAAGYSCGVLAGFLVEVFFDCLFRRMKTGCFPVGKFVFALTMCALGSAICLLLADRAAPLAMAAGAVVFMLFAGFLGRRLFGEKEDAREE